MAAEGGGVDSSEPVLLHGHGNTSEANLEDAAPSLNLTSDEKRVYGQLFRQADTDGVGVVTGETAVKFFEKTRLDQRILGEVSPFPNVTGQELWHAWGTKN